ELGEGRVAVLFEQDGSSPQEGRAEAEYTAETDDRGVYVEEPGAPGSPPSPVVTVQVRYRGSTPPTGTRLRIEQYSPNIPGFNEDAWDLVSERSKQRQSPYVTMAVSGQVADRAYFTVPLAQGKQGQPYATVKVELSGIRPGPPILRFTPIPAGAPESEPPRPVPFPAIGVQFFANVRVLPFHNAMA